MWTAMRSDLMDFVSIIADDTSKTLNKVIGEHAEEDEEMTIRQQMTTDLRRSYNTYGTPVEEQHSAQYEKFLKKFSLSSQANDIAELLDAEVDVSRYYAELVPSQVKPEDFWARYFFRLLLLSKEGHINLDDDDDEELLWETNDTEKAEKEDARGTGCPDNDNAAANNDSSVAKLLSKITSLEAENMRLKGQVKTLAGRVTELEKELTRQEQTHLPSSTTHVLPETTATGNDAKAEIKEKSQPNDTSQQPTAGSSNDSAEQSAAVVAAERSLRRSVVQEPLAAPYQSSTSPFAADSASSPFKPIATTSSGSTSVTLMGTRQSIVSNSATTLATESSINTGSVSPLTEVTEAFIRRAQRASQTATLSNINTSANVSICTSEQEQSSSYMNNNDLQSETASEDSGVLVVPEKGSAAVKGSAEAVTMEMSSLNFTNTADNVHSDAVAPSAAIEDNVTEGKGSVKVDTKSPAQLAALDGDEEEDDGWS